MVLKVDGMLVKEDLFSHEDTNCLVNQLFSLNGESKVSKGNPYFVQQSDGRRCHLYEALE